MSDEHAARASKLRFTKSPFFSILHRSVPSMLIGGTEHGIKNHTCTLHNPMKGFPT